MLSRHEEKEGTGHESEDWTNLTDRGALKHSSDSTHMLFQCMELELRKHLRDGCASEKSGVREKAVESILEDEDWSLVSVDWEEEESEVLLKKMLNIGLLCLASHLLVPFGDVQAKQQEECTEV